MTEMEKNMKKYNILVTKYGFITIEAESKKEARENAKEMGTDDFEWSDDIEIIDCQESENKWL